MITITSTRMNLPARTVALLVAASIAPAMLPRAAHAAAAATAQTPSSLSQEAYAAQQAGNYAGSGQMVVDRYDSVSDPQEKVRAVYVAGESFLKAWENSADTQFLDAGIRLLQRLEGDIPSLFSSDAMTRDMESKRATDLRQRLETKLTAAQQANAEAAASDYTPPATGSPDDAYGGLPQDFDPAFSWTPPPDPKKARRTRSRGGGNSKAMALSGFVMTMLGVAGGMATGFVGMSRGKKAKEELDGLADTDFSARRDAIAKGEQANIMAIAGAAAGAGLVVIGAILMGVAKKRRYASRTRVLGTGLEISF